MQAATAALALLNALALDEEICELVGATTLPFVSRSLQVVHLSRVTFVILITVAIIITTTRD